MQSGSVNACRAHFWCARRDPSTAAWLRMRQVPDYPRLPASRAGTGPAQFRRRSNRRCTPRIEDEIRDHDDHDRAHEHQREARTQLELRWGVGAQPAIEFDVRPQRQHRLDERATAKRRVAECFAKREALAANMMPTGIPSGTARNAATNKPAIT